MDRISKDHIYGFLAVGVLALLLALVLREYGVVGFTPEEVEMARVAPYVNYNADAQALTMAQTPDLLTSNKSDELVKSDGIDWNNAIMDMGLEQSVIDSHRTFVNDAARITTTASNVPIMEPTHVVPYVGLRRPDYQRVPMMPGARTIPSVDGAALPTVSRFLL